MLLLLWHDLGEPTHTLIPYWTPKPLPPRNTSVWDGSPQPFGISTTFSNNLNHVLA